MHAFLAAIGHWFGQHHDAIEAFSALISMAFTIILTVSTVLLWIVTRKAADATKVAADAAKATADAIQITERPYLFIWGMTGTTPSIRDNTQRTVRYMDPAFEYSVSNRGKLAAVVESVQIACGYEKNGQYPPLIEIGDHALVQSPIISADQDVRRELLTHHVSWRELDGGLIAETRQFRGGLIFRVVITYRGTFTSGHETSQCWRFGDPPTGGFVEVMDGRYTYSK